MIDIGIVGATGYTGAELLRLLLEHPQARLRVVTSRQYQGQRVDACFPQLRGRCDLSFTAPDAAGLSECRAVFFATPHGTAMTMAPELLARGTRLVDLSADFRLRDPAVYQHWYGQPHHCPELLAEAVYGLPEVAREAVRGARLVGCPGCYPTAVQLGFYPLLKAGVVDLWSLIADCKSGVSGAGREFKLGSMFSEAADSLKAYGVAGHRHRPEIEQGLSLFAGAAVKLTFVPHLVPMIRGIHATLYVRLTQPRTDVQALFEQVFEDEPFVDVMPAGALPETRSVRGSNLCRLAVHRPGDGDTVVVLAVEDNLVKGAAGQAVQCFNLMFDLPEQLGLAQPPLWP